MSAPAESDSKEEATEMDNEEVFLEDDPLKRVLPESSESEEGGVEEGEDEEEEVNEGSEKGE